MTVAKSMRESSLPFTAAALVFLTFAISTGPAHAQSALEELERRLFGGALSPAPAPARPDPPPRADVGAVYLGFRGETSPRGGVDILSVDAGGPAQAAGVRVGDRIVRFDGVDIRDLGALTRTVGRTRPEQLVSLRLQRGNAQITTSLTIGTATNRAPATPPTVPPATPSARGSLGVSVTPVTDSARRTYGLPVRRGAFVSSVVRNGGAAKAGVPVGSVIVAVDGRQITKPEELISIVQQSRAGQTLQLSLYEGNRLSVRRVQLAAAGSDLVTAPDNRGALEDRLGEGGRRPVLGALGRILDDVIESPGGGVPTPAPAAGEAAPTSPPAAVAVARDEQMQILIEEIRALRTTVDILQRRVERLEASRAADGEAAPKGASENGLDLKVTPPQVEGLPAPKDS